MPSVPRYQTVEPAPDDPSVELDEVQSLAAWEFLCLLDLGFAIEECLTLIDLPRFTWHDAEALLKKGWPHATVVDDLT